MSKNKIIHVSEVEVSPQSGMGRIEYHWKKAFEAKGYEFIHIGPKEVGNIPHRGLFPHYAYQAVKKLKLDPHLYIIHEPASGSFVNLKAPCFVESHGIERRSWELQKSGKIPALDHNPNSLKTKLLFPLWRLRAADMGLRRANKLLLTNSEDKAYAIEKYKRRPEDIFIFKNGVNIENHLENHPKTKPFTVLFNASWIERKGIYVLIDAAKILFAKGYKINYLIIGTGKPEQEVLKFWPESLVPYVTVIAKFPSEQEKSFIAQSSVFVLPSYFEGQPLSLLQAMAQGCCCITTDSCGQKDVIVHNQNGLLFETGDFEQLANLIEKCYADPALAERIGAHAQNSMKDLSWSYASEDVANYVLEICG